MPKVSVIIPAYNTAPYIAETLDSVFGQTFRDFEVIVINDGSPDTPALEVALQPYADRIHYLKQENHGVSRARNAGIRVARGELLAFVDSDDIWMPGYLAAQVDFLDRHPNVCACIADALLFGACPEPTVLKMLKEGAGPILNFEQMLKREGGQIPSATVARRQRVVHVGMFDEQIRIAEDMEFFVRLCFPDQNMGYLGEILVKYRQRPGSLTDDPLRQKWNAAEVNALRRLRESLDLSEGHRKLLAEEIAAADAAFALSDAYRLISEHDSDRAAQCLRQANTYYRDFRITAALVCLHIFPRLTMRVLSWRSKNRSTR